MARAHAEGHRVVLVVATNGEHGEVPDDLADGETLADRRRAETERSAKALGVDEVVWLGYADSGMTGWDANANETSFLRWPTSTRPRRRLAAILREQRADVLTIYDWHGNYGHPDHIKVYQVGCRAEQMVAADLPELRVFEATMNRDEMRRQMEIAREAGQQFEPDVEDDEFDPDGPMDDGNPMGTPEAELTMVVDVCDYVEQKRAGDRRPRQPGHRLQLLHCRCHAEMFAFAFGREWFIEHGREPGLQPGWLFDDR